jgi:diguanylate cyclase (GGDEF)-like protein
MRGSGEAPTRMSALRPAISEVNQSDRRIRRLRLLLFVTTFVELIAVFVPRISHQWRSEFGFLPQILIGFVALVLVLAIHLATQRKTLREVSTALFAATLHVDRLERLSLVDTATQLFNRRYLDQLFNRHLNWVARNGKSSTLVLVELLPNEQNTIEQIVVEAAFILRSSVRGSDYVVRYLTDQFLVVLPDTNEQQAQIALSRLIDKVNLWNTTNQERKIALRLVLSACLPGGNLWQKLNELEERLQNKSDIGVRTLTPSRPAGYDARELRLQEHLVQ